MIFTDSYSLKMPIGQTLLTALVGIVTVLVILSLIDVLIMIVSKAVRSIESRIKPEATLREEKKSPPEVPRESRAVELVGVDEPTAAVIMAIVCDKLGVPPEKLRFKSIRLMEDEKK